MIAYEQCMKYSVMLNPPTLNRWLQKGQGTWGCQGENRTTNTREAPNGCGEQGGKGASGPRKDEGISQSKLRRMGTMGGWMEVGT
jgi:hypothetical protein